MSLSLGGVTTPAETNMKVKASIHSSEVNREAFNYHQ
jgi:hypothetical protein